MEAMRAWLYVRTAHPDDVASYLAQLANVRKYAERLHLRIVGETSAVENGRFLEREGLSKVSDAVEAGFVDVVVVQNYSRIARSQAEMLKYSKWLRKNGVRLFSADGVEEADTLEDVIYTLEAIVEALDRKQRRRMVRR